MELSRGTKNICLYVSSQMTTMQLLLSEQQRRKTSTKKNGCVSFLDKFCEEFEVNE
jgi:hypothetical protein